MLDQLKLIAWKKTRSLVYGADKYLNFIPNLHVYENETQLDLFGSEYSCYIESLIVHLEHSDNGISDTKCELSH